MKAGKFILCGMVLSVFAMLAMPTWIPAQDGMDSGQDYRFSTEELTQMLAPIALYPDSLTAQILMAATYPLEVVEADRWRERNSQLLGSQLDSALQDQPWDPSVKALCHFPNILSSMSDKLDQTRKLGDVFLGQEQEVMATIQELRRKARQQGHLMSTGEQRVITNQDYIQIEPVNPEVVYVPVYDPAIVYGPWWYPAYPPYYWYYPSGYYGGASISFGPRIFLGFDLFSWVRFDWPTHRIHLDIDRTSRFHHPGTRHDSDGPFWRHDLMHRRGVAYRDLRTRERFGLRPPRATPLSRERRGYPQQQRPTQAIPRTDLPVIPPQRHEPNAQRLPEVRREKVKTPRVRTELVRPQQPVVRDTPFRGIGEGSFERRAGERGGISNRGVENIRPRSGQNRLPQFGGSPGRQMNGQDSGGARGGQKRQDDGSSRK